jgi:ribosomal protein L13
MPAPFTPQMTAPEVSTYLDEVFPQIRANGDDVCVLDVSPGAALVRLNADHKHLRPGGTVSGPTLFMLADLGAYAVILAHIGRVALAVTTNLNINSQKPADVVKKWVLIDAEGLVVGRLASIVAVASSRQAQAHLHPACRRWRQRHHHQRRQGRAHRQEAVGQGLLLAHRPSGRHQGTHRRAAARRPFPERVVEKAIERMIPRGPLGRRQMKNLRVYAGAEHPHEAQQPEVLDVAALNSKNKKVA